MNSFDEETRQFIDDIKASAVYRNYCEKKDALKKDPELWEQVTMYRFKTFELQSFANGDELFDKTDAFEREYSSLKEKKAVSDFLDAELALCRMLQKISMSLMEALDFE